MVAIALQGLKAIVSFPLLRQDRGNALIEPYSQEHTVYSVFRSQRAKGRLPWTCSTDDHNADAVMDSQLPHGSEPDSNKGELK